MLVGLIVALILLSAGCVFCGWKLVETRKELEKERTALVEYKRSCYCKEIVP